MSECERGGSAEWKYFWENKKTNECIRPKKKTRWIQEVAVFKLLPSVHTVHKSHEHSKPTRESAV